MIKKYKNFESSDIKGMLDKMKNISDNKSVDKSDVDIKLKSVEYIVYKMINWYISVSNIKSIYEFNSKNEFNEIKLSLFPFFIFAADCGNRDIIINIFNFSATDIGIVDIDVMNLLKKSNLYKINVFNIEIEKEYFNVDYNGVTIKNKYYFKDIEKYTSIFDDSINQLINFNSKLINSNNNTLKFCSQRHTSWQIYYNGKTTIIDKRLLLREKSIFSDRVETITYT